MGNSVLRRTTLVVSCAAVFVGSGLTVAYAGEITGTGRSLEVVPVPNSDPRVHGKSECAYSGLNDDWVLATGDKTDIPHVQTPAGAPPGVPGFACNPSGARG